MTAALTFDVEWQRIGLLAACVQACRRGAETAPDTKKQLETINREVAAIRQGARWSEVVERHGLLPMDQDILSCSLAPEAEPQIGWMFQELQPGVGSPYPTPALLRELLFLESNDAEHLFKRLDAGSPLVQEGLIERGTIADSYSPIRPTGVAKHCFLGRTPASFSLPGAIEVDIGAVWDDLVLPDHCLRALKELLLWITHRPKVVGQWGARIHGGPVALLAGPSGTGKTFAAEAIAANLGWRLFRVDLGLLVSKYIGETEKNLSALFDAAHGRRVVLLFDEADSLFGKRGDVRDARDRYANMEVSHLLTRVERHLGPCILTSNLRQHMDPAFARRFQAVIEFPVPDARQRARLWQMYLPPRAPMAKDVDAQLLADAVTLTGGQIKNAAIQAAFLAADELMPITLSHLASAIWREFAKEGREVFHSSLGVLAQHLPEEPRQ